MIRRLVKKFDSQIIYCLIRNSRKQSTKICINVKQGKVIGREKKLPNGNSFYYFKGIPYAIPPIKDLRFQDPQELNEFANKILDCDEERSVAFHRDPLSRKIIGSEDCLYLNVYTPKIIPAKCLPVMIWIHGGGFSNGSGNSDFFNPLYLLQENVIVVTLNYRLGALGFLCLPDGDVPGNAGLKDQLFAFKWINDNIHQFNGDPSNITLFGHSAGAVSIHLHLLSETSQNYFHKAIIQSGTATMEWVMQNNPKYKARKLAAILGFKRSASDIEIVNFLKNQKLEKLLNHQLDVFTSEEKRREFPIAFKPVVENEFNNITIISKSPKNLLKVPNKIKVPVIMGNTSREGIVILENAIKKLENFNNDLGKTIPMSVQLASDNPEFSLLAEEIRKYFFNGQNLNSNNINKFCDLLTDTNFNLGTYISAEHHARYQHNSPLYFYRFAYDGGLNMYKKWFQLQTIKGACHGDELFYLFQMSQLGEPLQSGSKDEKMVKEMCRMWTNFAKFNNPTPDDDNLLNFKWNPVRNIKENDEKFVLDYLEIDENCKMQQDPDKDRIDFWIKIYQKHNKGILN